MTFTAISPLPSAKSVHSKIPVTNEVLRQIKAHRKEIRDIISGKDDRLLLIIGPCSAWPDMAVIEYSKKLAQATDPLLDKIKPVLRIYTQKPRTILGWKGSLLHPDPFGSPNVLDGIQYCRSMIADVATKTGLALADEILYPDLALPYLGDLYSYGCIGARSSEHQRKRMVASGVDFPIGIKNPTSGDLVTGVQSVQVAQASHLDFPHIGQIVQTTGNPHAHIVLRGGGGKPNYDTDSLKKVEKLLHENKIVNPAIIIDASHENCIDPDGKKDYKRQIEVVESVLKYRKNKNKIIKGIMIESFLESGSQKNLTDEKNHIYGCSITDGCLGWETTEQLIKNIVDLI